MLVSLKIENYAIIRSLKIGFHDGFTAITGETGAGKSILLGALSLLFGSRADSSILFDTSKKCVVEGEFAIDNLNLHHFFTINDLDYQDVTIIRREISVSGKSRAFINDTPVNLNTLRELTAQLVDIHSQHSHLLLANSDFKLKIVDDYASNFQLLNQYKADYKQYKRLIEQLACVREEAVIAEKEQDFVEFQLQELQQANLNSGEQEILEKDIDMLSHAEDIKSNLFQSSILISEKEDCILQQLHQCKQFCQNIESYHTDFEDFYKRLVDAEIELKDLGFEIQRRATAVEFNPDELELKKERLNLIYALEKKHNVQSIEDLLSIQKILDQKSEKLLDYQLSIEKLERDIAQIEDMLGKQGQVISQRRAQAIPLIEKALQSKIAYLGMPYNTIHFDLVSGENLRKDGIDTIELLFSANQGVAVAPIEKAASGGELSRVMLAVKSLLTEQTLFPTIIFDEIDTGISGTIAGKVAQAMNELAQAHQLIVITHLPQIAAQAQYQYKVYKEIVEDKTFTNLKALSAEEREQEIALMIGGEKVSEATLLTAHELLSKH